MGLQEKPLPPPSFSLVFNPEKDREYRHFEGAVDVPFDPTAVEFSAQNAWWLADASLLAYWEETDARQRFHEAGLESAPIIQKADTQCYVAWTARFALAAFRGSEPDSLPDILTDIRALLKPWDEPNETVHHGFREALDAVWPEVVAALTPLADRPVWFTGHSLGGALATLAADRCVRQRAMLGLGDLGGVYTFGSPLVGNRHFVDGFNSRVHGRSFRFVNDQDGVPRVPPQLLGYRHVNTEHFVGEDGPGLPFSEPLIDHTPRRYAVLVWNALVEAAGC